jgi:hypothetical protein
MTAPYDKVTLGKITLPNGGGKFYLRCNKYNPINFSVCKKIQNNPELFEIQRVIALTNPFETIQKYYPGAHVEMIPDV